MRQTAISSHPRRLSMSAEELSKLSLADTMVTTRAGAARAPTAPVQGKKRGSQSPSPSPLPTTESSLPSPTPSIIEAVSGVKYNVSIFGTDIRRRVKRGVMENNIKMKYCRVLDEESNHYLFYLDDEIQIAMGGGYDAPRCTCGANDGGVACKVSIKITSLRSVH